MNSTHPADEETLTKGLRGNMGVLSVMFTVLAYNGPAVVFMGFIPVLILLGNGAGTPALILAAALLILLVASAILRVTKKLQRPGGYYSIISASLGRTPGLAGGTVAFLTYFPALLSVYFLGGFSLSNVVTILFNGSAIPWWIGGAIMLVIVTILGHFNIDFSAKALFVLLGLELLLIAVYILSVLFQGGADGISFASFDPTYVFSGTLAVGMLFAVGIFGGFEATVIFIEEVKNPGRTIPRATYGTIATMGIGYSLLAFAFINAYGPQSVMQVVTDNLTDSAGDSIKQYVGEFAYDAAIVLLFTSSFALALATHNILSRYLFNFGADGILPKSLGYAHPKHVSPSRASIVVSVLSVIFLIVLVFSQIPDSMLYATTAGLYSYGMLILMTIVSIALGVFLITKVDGAKFHGVITIVVGLIFGLILFFASTNFVLLTGLEGVAANSVLLGFWLLIVLSLVYATILKAKKPEVYARIGRQ